MSNIQWADLDGALLLVKVHDTQSVRADVVVLDGEREGVTYADAVISPSTLQTQVRGHAVVLGRLGLGHAKPGQPAPWILSAANPDDRAKGRKQLIAS